MDDLLTIDINKVFDHIKKKRLVSRYSIMIGCLFLSSIVFNLLILPSNIVSGGVNGISVITKYIYGWNPSIVIFVVSGILLIFSLLYLGLERTSGTIVGTIVYPIFVSLTSGINNYISIDTNDLLILSIFIGVLSGLLNGFICKTGFSGGGLPIVSQIIHKKFKLPVGKVSFIVNGIVVVIGGFFFGWTMVMYALIILYINSIMIDKVLLGISDNKAFYIITSNEEQIKKYLIEEMKHSVTVFDVKGAFLEKKRKVLLSVIPTREYFRVTEGIKQLDKDAFFMVTDSYQVQGGK